MADKLYQCMKVVAKSKGIKASPEHDLYKMIPTFFINAFYSDLPGAKNSDKITVEFSYEVKYSYFDDLTLNIIDPASDIKLTDKIRANSGIACRSVIENEQIEYDFDGKDESYQQLAEAVFAHIESWYKDFEEKVKSEYGDLEAFFLSNKDKYPRQAALIYIHSENYAAAEECMKLMPAKMNSSRLINPTTEEQIQRLVDSGAEKFGKESFLRDDMDCHRDFLIAKKKGLVWTGDRARFGLLNEERAE